MVPGVLRTFLVLNDVCCWYGMLYICGKYHMLLERNAMCCWYDIFSTGCHVLLSTGCCSVTGGKLCVACRKFCVLSLLYVVCVTGRMIVT